MLISLGDSHQVIPAATLSCSKKAFALWTLESGGAAFNITLPSCSEFPFLHLPQNLNYDPL